MPEEPPARLDQAMHEQRLRLDLTWKQIAERGGMTEFTLQRIRGGKTKLTDRAAAKIDRAMEWELGSARRIYDEGGDPTALRRDQSPPDNIAQMLAELGIDPAKWRRVPQSTRDAVTTAYRVDREQRRARETQRAHGT